MISPWNYVPCPEIWPQSFPGTVPHRKMGSWCHVAGTWRSLAAELGLLVGSPPCLTVGPGRSLPESAIDNNRSDNNFQLKSLRPCDSLAAGLKLLAGSPPYLPMDPGRSQSVFEQNTLEWIKALNLSNCMYVLILWLQQSLITRQTSNEGIPLSLLSASKLKKWILTLAAFSPELWNRTPNTALLFGFLAIACKSCRM